MTVSTAMRSYKHLKAVTMWPGRWWMSRCWITSNYCSLRTWTWSHRRLSSWITLIWCSSRVWWNGWWLSWYGWRNGWRIWCWTWSTVWWIGIKRRLQQQKTTKTHHISTVCHLTDALKSMHNHLWLYLMLFQINKTSTQSIFVGKIWAFNMLRTWTQ